jgi:hypothetical protein
MPADGTSLRERQSVPLEVELSNVAGAQLYVDIGGVENAAGNPPPVTVTPPSASTHRFPFTMALPSVAHDTVVVLRLVETGTALPQVARRYVQVLNDESVPEQPDLTLRPASTVLGGSQLWVDAKVPSGMNDFATSSSVSVEDPAGS